MINKGDRFKRVKDEVVIEVVGADDSTHEVTVATVTASGSLTNRRKLSVSHLHENPFNLRGERWKSGYVKQAGTLGEPDLSRMSDEELAKYACERVRQAEEVNDAVNNAKAEIRKREIPEGTNLFGDVAIVAQTRAVFNGALARRVLDPEKLREISVLTPNADRAKELFGRKSELYRSMCKDQKTALTIRMATEKDLRKAQDGVTSEEVLDDEPPF